MSATCVPRYVPRSNTGLSKHGYPVFPHFCPLHQNLARVRRGARGGTIVSANVAPVHKGRHITTVISVFLCGAIIAVQLSVHASGCVLQMLAAADRLDPRVTKWNMRAR